MGSIASHLDCGRLPTAEGRPCNKPVSQRTWSALQSSFHSAAHFKQHAQSLHNWSVEAANGLSSSRISSVNSPQQQHQRKLLVLPSNKQQANAVGTPSPLGAWLQNSTQYRTYANGSCFPKDPTFLAANIGDFVRLIKDPKARQIQLVGDLLFSTDYFPPEYAHDITQGINVTHVVEIRACTSQEEPIVVDVNNVMREVYVVGHMTWQGTIKFINSYPSPRRAGLFPLISVLSVEGAGVILFKGVQIQGYEPSPLFSPQDPYWEVHNDPAFAPQPYEYIRLNSSAMIMRNWTYNRTAWLLHSQGPHGLVQSTGDGYWQWLDVLISWSPPSSGSGGGGGLVGPALALAVVLPVVLGSLLLAAGGGLLWWGCSRRRTRHRTTPPCQHTLASKQHQLGAGEEPVGSRHTSCADSLSGLSNLVLPVERSQPSTKDLIEATRLRMRQSFGGSEAAIDVKGLLGEGTFGRVYSANWKGTLVAVKTMLLPAAMSGMERREKMAIMETAISSSLSHPNIVQTYTYEVKPMSGELARKCQPPGGGPATAGSGLHNSYSSSLDDTTAEADFHGWEVRLVLELCDGGNMEAFLLRGGFDQPSAQQHILSLLATAEDIARAMLHLHTENVIHGDLKARNVLLKSSGADVRGFVAKVSDFGLSMRIDPSETHVSNFYQGTLTHMAPEVLMYGKIGFASDVYAFGIMLWEMYTAMQAFKGVPRALLGHEVARMGRRPEFPPNCPVDYQLLACRCWESDPAIRPTFSQILTHLQLMRQRLQGQTPQPGSTTGSLLPTSTNSSMCSTEPLPAATPGIQGHLGHPRNAARLIAAAGAAAAAADGAKRSAEQSAETGTTELPLSRSSQLGVASASTSAGIGGPAHHAQHHRAIELPVWQPQQQQQQQQQTLQAGGALCGPAAAAAGGIAPWPDHPLQPAISLGTWEAPSGGGLWPSGSLAPEELAGLQHSNRQLSGGQRLAAERQPQLQAGGGQQWWGPGRCHTAASCVSETAPHDQHGLAAAGCHQQLAPAISLGTWEAGDVWQLEGSSMAPLELQQGTAALLPSAQPAVPR